MRELERTICFEGLAEEEHERLLTREWLVTNGLGGYASGTVSGVPTRRYHGLLIASLPAPLARTLLLAHVSERVRLPDGRRVQLSGEETTSGALKLHGAAEHLTHFRLEGGLPVWRYQIGGYVFEKHIFMPHEQNTVHVTYRLLEGDGPVRLKLLPAVHFRNHDAPVDAPLPAPFTLTATEDRYELAAAHGYPPLRMRLSGERSAFTIERKPLPGVLYRLERDRGYPYVGEQWSPGYFRVDLHVGERAAFTASTEDWGGALALPPPEALEVEHDRRRRLLAVAAAPAREGLGAELLLAADQFLIKPAGRVADSAYAHASGDEARTVIAGYHWFTDWGRDTMISLEGLTLATGRHAEAGYLLRTFAHYIRDGLIPNLFPEGQSEGVYHSADATLWLFHALDRYVQVSGDRSTLNQLLPKLGEIVKHHLRGTRFGIGVDEQDGLLRQGAEGYQLTWMDAKVDDWVVTPRRGKAVEINALWYNALRLMESWTRERDGEDSAAVYKQYADRAFASFNERFWCEKHGHLYDVVDGEEGDDPACRPNQVFAIAMPHAVLEESRWRPVLDVARKRLLTPVGLRSLAPGCEDYKPQYYGNLRARDAAYHQGTVWAWLIGPFIDAWLRVYPDRKDDARAFLHGLSEHLEEACIGSISEIFDAEPPFTPRGCIAQAWSIAEALRCWVKTAE